MVLEVRGCRGAPRPSVYVPFSFFILVRVSKSLCFLLAVPQILQIYMRTGTNFNALFPLHRVRVFLLGPVPQAPEKTGPGIVGA